MNCKSVLAAALAASVLAGCAGGANAGLTPQAAPAGRQASGHKKVKVVLRVRVPKKARRPHKHGRYVSPATQSVKVVITNASPPVDVVDVADLTPTSTGCSSTLADLLCELTVSLAPATGYAATVTTYDQTHGNGNVLSTGQNLDFDVTAGTNNEIDMTLSGVPASIVVLPGSGRSRLDENGSIDIIGTAASRLFVEALDADHQFIVGPGAPSFSVSQVSGFTTTIVQPGATTPNAFTVQPPPAYTSGKATFTVQAAFASGMDGCAQTGAVCSTSFSIAMLQVTAVANATSVYLYETASGSAIATVTAPGAVNGIAFDRSGNLYVSNCGANCGAGGSDALLEYAPPYTGSALSNANGIVHPEGVATDSSGNVYVANDPTLVAAGTDNVAVFAAGYKSTDAPAKTITNTINQPGALAIDPLNNLFVANVTGNTITGYAQAYTSGVPTYSMTTAGHPGPLAVDASGNVYAGVPSANEVQKFYGYSAVQNGATPYSCTGGSGAGQCGNGITVNPRNVSTTLCNGCTVYTPASIVTLPTSGNSPYGYSFAVANSTLNSNTSVYNVYVYSNATNAPALSKTISSGVATPFAVALDGSNNLFVANNTANTVTKYNAGSYSLAGTFTNSVAAPTTLAILP